MRKVSFEVEDDNIDYAVEQASLLGDNVDWEDIE